MASPIRGPRAEDASPLAQDNRSVRVYGLGTTDYKDVLQLQRELQAARRKPGTADCLLLTQHRPVITLGRAHPAPDLRVAQSVVRAAGIEIVQTERGGDITYHGPGQLVVYGIVDLRGWGIGVVDYLAGLEDALIGTLADWGAQGQRSSHGRGVWVGERKIGSVGLNVRRGVTMHGAALNVAPEMTHFDLINACGMADVRMTSLAEELSTPVEFAQVCDSFVAHFGRVFGCATPKGDVAELARFAASPAPPRSATQ